MREGTEATESNRNVVDRFSIVHAAVGAVLEASGVPAWLAIGSHIAFEAVENSLKDAASELWPDARPDAMANHLGDVASFTAGYYSSRSLRKTTAGQATLAGLAGLAGMIWMYSLTNKHTWRAKPRT